MLCSQVTRNDEDPNELSGPAATGVKGSVEGLMRDARTAQLEMELHVKEQEIQALKVHSALQAPSLHQHYLYLQSAHGTHLQSCA